MRLRFPFLPATVLAAAIPALLVPSLLAPSLLPASPSARASSRQPAAAPPGHVILKAGGGTIALATGGPAGAPVYAGRYRGSSHAEDWHTDHEAGAAFPGGRFGLYWAPGGVQTDLYVHTGATSYLVTGAPAATVFTAAPASGGYTALTYLAGGSQLTTFELTYLGGGMVALRPEGAGGPTADQLWKVTG